MTPAELLSSVRRRLLGDLCFRLSPGLRLTTLRDRNDREIKEGNFVSLAGNITSDNSMGSLPNGWTFDESDVYQVYFDGRINNWSLRLGVEPDSPYNKKYLNHAVSLLHGKGVEIVNLSEGK